MHSNDLSDFCIWMKWPLTNFREVPRRPGVYVFRLADAPKPRLRAESDIIYIGFSEQFHDRIRQHRDAKSVERNTAYNLQRVKQEVGSLEVSWRTFDTKHEATNLESYLLEKFAVGHIELPPLNRLESGKSVRMFCERFGALTRDEQQFVFES
jgi:hypothetical protein